MKETILEMERYAEENNIPIIEVDSIKFFDVESQLSLKELDFIDIYPYTEFLLNENKEGIDKKQKKADKSSNPKINKN